MSISSRVETGPRRKGSNITFFLFDGGPSGPASSGPLFTADIAVKKNQWIIITSTVTICRWEYDASLDIFYTKKY